MKKDRVILLILSLLILIIIAVLIFIFGKQYFYNDENSDIGVNYNMNTGLSVSTEILSGDTSGGLLTGSVILSGDIQNNSYENLSYQGTYLSGDEFNNGFSLETIDTTLKLMIKNEKLKDSGESALKKELNKDSLKIVYIHDSSDIWNTKDYFLINDGNGEKQLDPSYKKYNTLEMERCKNCKTDCKICTFQGNIINFEGFNDISKDKHIFIYKIGSYESCGSLVVQDFNNGNYMNFYCSDYYYNINNGKLLVIGFDDDFGGEGGPAIYNIESLENGATNKNILSSNTGIIYTFNARAIYSDDNYVYYIYDSDLGEPDTYLLIFDINTYQPIFQKNLGKDYRNKTLGY